MGAAGCIDQLRSDPHATARLAHRTFQYIAHAQFAADLLHVDGLALVGKARIPGDDKEPADAGERGDDFLDHAVGEILLLGVAGHVLERQNRYRRLVGQRQWRRRGTFGGSGASITDSVDPYGPGNVLDLLLAQILEDK